MTTSLNVTIHNKEYLLPLFLENLVKNTVGEYEIIFVLDKCNDKSFEKVDYFCEKYIDTIPIKILEPEEELFEVKANNLAAKNSEGDIVIIIQDDQIITEHGWNERIIKPFQAFDDVFAVSGRAAHNWFINPASRDIKTDKYANDRWCDILGICDIAQGDTPRNEFAIRDYVNRGPLAIKHEDLKKLNYFDEFFYPLIGDEMDLCYKMKKQLGKVVGVYAIGWHSKEEWGGTRDEITGHTKPWVYEASHKNIREVYRRYKNIIPNKTIESRILT